LPNNHFRFAARALFVSVSSAVLLVACHPADNDVNLNPDATDDNAELDYIAPQAEVINVGYAGQDPANIARYLLARGADDVTMSPSGEFIAYTSGVTGLPQLWIIPAAGGQARLWRRQ